MRDYEGDFIISTIYMGKNEGDLPLWIILNKKINDGPFTCRVSGVKEGIKNTN